MKLAHRPRIASTMIKLISNPILLPILLILVKTIKRIVADAKRKLSPPFDSADSVPSLGHPAPGSGKMLSLFTVLCDYPVCVTEFGAPVRVKRFSHSEFSSTTAAVARTMFRLDRFRNHSHSGRIRPLPHSQNVTRGPNWSRPVEWKIQFTFELETWRHHQQI